MAIQISHRHKCAAVVGGCLRPVHCEIGTKRSSRKVPTLPAVRDITEVHRNTSVVVALI
jgi:hypothetical protein